MRPFGRTFWLCLAGVAILAVIGIVVAFRVPSDLRPHHPGEGAPLFTPPPSSSLTKAMCSDSSVADMTSEANRDFSSGNGAAALRGIRRALACRPDDAQLNRLAATFACAARDPEAATHYLHKIPESFHASIRQLCQQANVNLAP